MFNTLSTFTRGFIIERELNSFYTRNGERFLHKNAIGKLRVDQDSLRFEQIATATATPLPNPTFIKW